ncbi:hypothetical protein [uncultured Methylobacterium sp.]|uniref:hypothetical protein n=1 Tax=uncultured Methylobacterium sp. TaxID=157278 RepID=UPI002592BF46|nr:hypothetical protein [uncultured Methylobacterium sp.]
MATSPRPDAGGGLDRTTEPLAEFDMTVTFCSIPRYRGIPPHPARPPRAKTVSAMVQREAGIIRRRPARGPQPAI